MPTYEYACTSCGEHLEVAQSFRDDPLRQCPACGGPLRKVFGSIGVVFKGSGFYKTDSRPAAKSGGDKDKAAASTGSEGGGTDGSKSDTAASAKDKSAATTAKAPSDTAGSPKSPGSGTKTATSGSSTAAAS